MSMTVQQRQDIERKIVEAVIDQLLESGFYININNGGDADEFRIPTADKKRIMDTLFATNAETIWASQPGTDKAFGFVEFVYGNDGWDVIANYSTRLELYLTKAQKISDGWIDAAN